MMNVGEGRHGFRGFVSLLRSVAAAAERSAILRETQLLKLLLLLLTNADLRLIFGLIGGPRDGHHEFERPGAFDGDRSHGRLEIRRNHIRVFLENFNDVVDRRSFAGVEFPAQR